MITQATRLSAMSDAIFSAFAGVGMAEAGLFLRAGNLPVECTVQVDREPSIATAGGAISIIQDHARVLVLRGQVPLRPRRGDVFELVDSGERFAVAELETADAAAWGLLCKA